MSSFKVGDKVEHVDNAPGYVGRVMLPQSSAESVTVEWPFGVQVENAHFIKLAPVRVYLAGPMRGKPDFNFPSFDRSAQQLRMFGYEVFSPAEHDRKVGFDPTGMTGHEDLADYGFDLRKALAADMEYIASKAAVVAVLAGWEESSGARAEVALAHALGLPVVLWWRLPKSGEEIPDSVLIKSDHVPSGRVVKDGEQIGVSGSVGALAGLCPTPSIKLGRAETVNATGRTFGNHLHFEKWANGKPPAIPAIPSVGDIPGEVRTTSSTGGQKGIKPECFSLIPVEALEAVARHYAIGAKKYAKNQWRFGYEWSKSFDALQRHAMAFWRGEDIDEETKSPHMAAVAFHALTLLTFMNEQPDHDDRYRKGDHDG